MEPFLIIIKLSAISLTTGREEDENIIVVLNLSLRTPINLIICAATVTSNGIVILSAISNFGELNKASTIIALCIIPPLYCDGYSKNLFSGEGINTSSKRLMTFCFKILLLVFSLSMLIAFSKS